MCDGFIFEDGLGLQTAFPMDRLSLAKKDGKLILRLHLMPIEHIVADITPAIKEIAKAQYRREREQRGDPPYSICNEWLLKLGEEHA